MIKNIKRIFSILSIVVLTSCGVSSTIHHDYDPKYPFKLVKTFAFSKNSVDTVELINDLDKRRVLYAMDQSLLSQGLTHSDTSPDIRLGFRMTEVQQNFPGQVGFGFGGPWWFMNSQQPVTQVRYVVHIEARDQKTNTLAWEGQGVLPVHRAKDNPQKRNQIFNNVIAKIMKKFPSQPAQTIVPEVMTVQD